MTPVTTLALSTVLLFCLVSSAAAANRVAEEPTLVQDTEPQQQPPASNARPHLRPRPAPDRFFDLVLTMPGKPVSLSPIKPGPIVPGLGTGS